MNRRCRNLTQILWIAALSAACSSPPVVRPPPPPETPTDRWPARPQVSQTVQAQFPVAKVGAIRKTAAGAGVTTLVVEHHELPIVHLRWVIPGGRMVGFAGAGERWPAGTLQFAEAAATMGTKTHPGTAFGAAVGDLGASVQVHALGDALVFEVQVLSHQLPKLVPLLRELVLEPAFDKNDLESVRRRMHAELTAEQGDADAIASKLALQLVFGASHPYAADAATLESLPKIQRKQVLEAWAAATRLGGSTLAAVGDVQPEALAQAFEREFGAALETVPMPPSVPLPQAPTLDSCHVVQVPGAVQVAVRQVVPGPTRRVANWPALIVANQIIGGSGSSRLFTELREKRGFSYGIYSGFDARRTAGRWTLEGNVRTEVLGDALLAIDDQLQMARRNGPSDAELGDAKRYLTGQFALALASGDSLVDYLAAVPLYGLPADEFEKYAAALQSVSADNVLEAAVQTLPAAGRVSVLVGEWAQTRPGLDAACRRIVEHDAAGKVVRVLVGSDEEMGDAGRQSAFAAWLKAPQGMVALGRYVAEKARSAGYRSDVLALLARGEGSGKVTATGRAAADWKKVLAPALVPKLLAMLHDADPAVQKRAHAVLLDMANHAGDGGKLTDLEDETAKAVRAAVADWAFADLGSDKAPDAAQKLIEGRLDEGDLALLGDAINESLEHFIANDVRRHEAADALLRHKSPANTKALVRGYRRLFAYGVAPVDRDLQAIGKVEGVDSVALLLDRHALLQASDMPHAVTRTAGLMATARDLLDRLATEKAADGSKGSELEAHFDRIESHIENLLSMRNADDRWLAAGLLTRYRGVLGLRHALTGLADDDHYKLPRWRTVDPKKMVATLAREDIAKLGADAEPMLLAALAGDKPISKVVAVVGLKALNSAGAMAALRTCTDETDIAAYLELPNAFTVRDLALAAVDVMKMWQQIDKQVAAGEMSKESAAIYKEVSFFILELADKRLREEVHRQVLERTPAAPPPETATPAAKPD